MSAPAALALSGLSLLVTGFFLASIGNVHPARWASHLAVPLMLTAPLCFIGAFWWEALR